MLQAPVAENVPVEPAATAAPRPSPPLPSRRALWCVLFAIAALAAGGIDLALWIREQWMGQPDPRDGYNVFYVLFSRNEVAALGLVFASACCSALWLARGAPPPTRSLALRPKAIVLLLAFAVLLLAAAGHRFVFHGYNLTADEYMADFQAQIFAHGRLTAPLPKFWEPMVRLILPTHAAYLPSVHGWSSSYLPAYAAMRALFLTIGLENLLNPFLGAVSILLVAAVAQRIWPNDYWKPLIAAALLASSSQLLLMSMTAYAMPAHLALNLLWLWLYLQPERKRFWLTPLFGVIALALHQPFFHALFVTPFLLRLVRDRRWKTASYFAAVYLLGIAGCLAWWHYFLPGFGATGSKSAFALHGYTWMIQAIYLCLLLAWLSLPLPLLAGIGFSQWKKQPAVVRDAIMSCLLTFGFYIFVSYDQAHGWGDRYFHGTLGCLVLVALAGWDSFVQRIGKASAAAFVVVGVVASLLIQFPLRCYQAEQFVFPYAEASAEMHAAAADVVGFSPLDAWYSGDLIRNDPFLQERPVIISFFSMKKSEAKRLQQAFPRNRIFTRSDLRRAGLDTETYR